MKKCDGASTIGLRNCLSRAPTRWQPPSRKRHEPYRGSVAAGRDVAPVLDRVAHVLRAARAVRERQLPVRDPAAASVLLDVVPVAERELVLELRRLLAGEVDRPVGGVDAGERGRARIPLRVAAVEPIEE